MARSSAMQNLAKVVMAYLSQGEHTITFKMIKKKSKYLTVKDVSNKRFVISRYLRKRYGVCVVPVTAHFVNKHNGIIPQEPIEQMKCVSYFRLGTEGKAVGFYVSEESNPLMEIHMEHEGVKAIGALESTMDEVRRNYNPDQQKLFASKLQEFKRKKEQEYKELAKHKESSKVIPFPDKKAITYQKDKPKKKKSVK